MRRTARPTPDAPTLVWFRLDLRLTDNPALLAAVDRGKPQYCSFKYSDAISKHYLFGGNGLARSEGITGHLSFDSSCNLPSPAGNHAFIEDFCQHCVMKGFPLLRGE